MSTLFSKQCRRDRSKRSRSTSEPELELDANISETTILPELPTWASFEDTGLLEPLVQTCRGLGYKRPTPVQRAIIPFLIHNQESHVLSLAATGSGKTAAFVLPILHHLQADPYSIYAVILTPTRELAKQIHQQVLALGSAYNVSSVLVVGGLDSVRQSCAIDNLPHFLVATPGRLAELLRGPVPPRVHKIRYMVLDEADRLLAPSSGFERDVAELLLHCTTTSSDHAAAPVVRRRTCQTLLFSATMTRSLSSIEEMAGAGLGRLPLKKFVIRDGHTIEPAHKKLKTDEVDATPESPLESRLPAIPAGLKQEYVFMPSRVRDAYLLTALRALMAHGGKTKAQVAAMSKSNATTPPDDEESKARSAIIFVATCERAALISETLTQVGVANVALHSLLSQNRRLAALGRFQSEQVRVLVATDVASRGLDIPTVDLVVNAELPRNVVSYIHRVGRTARAGRRGRAVSLVAETDVALVQATERATGRQLEKCTQVTDEMALQLLGSVLRATRVAKMKLLDIGFDELVQKFRARKARDKKDRERIERALSRMTNQE
jgi:ATP-dependent RNA helicase DDX49/DBP8